MRLTEFRVFVIGLFAILVANCVTIEQDTRQDQITSPGNLPTNTPPPAPPPNAPPVATVAVIEFTGREGINCGAAPQMTIGCKALVTCTPRDAQGNDLGKSYIPAWSTLGTLFINPTTINFYNARAECETAGLGAVSCTVGGVVGTLQLTCVAAP